MSVLDDFHTFRAAARDALGNAGQESMNFIAPLGADSVILAGIAYPEEANARSEEIIAGFKDKPFGAIATRCLWSPDAGPSSEAWALVAVRLGHPATFEVRRIIEDDHWWVLDAIDVPWFLASTAGSLRQLLARGEWSPVKSSTQPELFRSVAEGALPPGDDQGFI